jgi:hypothetical protein
MANAMHARTAVHINDVVPLPIIFDAGKFCENLPMKIISITPFK